MSDLIDQSLVKSHLHVVHARDDAYIELLTKASLKAVQNFIDRDFAEVLQEDGSLPEDLVFAALLIIGDMHAHRAAQSQVSLYINDGYERLMRPYRRMGV